LDERGARDLTSASDDTLHIAEILYDTGEIHQRYARRPNPDGTGWVRQGLFVAYSRQGSVVSEGNYVDGLEEGLWRDFHENGQLAAEGHYVRGQQEGPWRFWGSDGRLQEECVYRSGREMSSTKAGN